MLAWAIIEDIFSPRTKVFCLEIYFLLYFSCTFNLLFRNSSFHGFFFFFWKKKFMVWEKVWCGLGVAKSVLALQVFMGWNNHILLYWKPFSFLSKNSEALESSIFAGSGVWISVNSWCAQPLSRWMQAFEELHPRGRWFGQRVLPPHLFTSETDTRAKEWLDQDAS